MIRCHCIHARMATRRLQQKYAEVAAYLAHHNDQSMSCGLASEQDVLQVWRQGQEASSNVVCRSCCACIGQAFCVQLKCTVSHNKADALLVKGQQIRGLCVTVKPWLILLYWKWPWSISRAAGCSSTTSSHQHFSCSCLLLPNALRQSHAAGKKTA